MRLPGASEPPLLLCPLKTVPLHRSAPSAPARIASCRRSSSRPYICPHFAMANYFSHYPCIVDNEGQHLASALNNSPTWTQVRRMLLKAAYCPDIVDINSGLRYSSGCQPVS